MASTKDGPSSAQFKPIKWAGNVTLSQLNRKGVSAEMAKCAKEAPRGDGVGWGIPFNIDKLVLVKDKPVTVKLGSLRFQWLVFMHASDVIPLETDRRGFTSPTRGRGRLNEHAADYCVIYADGSEECLEIRRQHQVGVIRCEWGDRCLQAVSARKPVVLDTEVFSSTAHCMWGRAQFRVFPDDTDPFGNWIWAWENPHPRKAIAAIRFEPVCGAVVVSALTAGKASEMPIRWRTRRKAMLTLPKGTDFDGAVDDTGAFKHIKLDMGHVISVIQRPVYPNRAWARTYANKLPEVSQREVLLEYTSHPDACFHLPGGRTIPVAKVEAGAKSGPIQQVAPAMQRVTLRVVEKSSRKKVAVKLHVHGREGEYLTPVDRHRIPNRMWFQDYSVDVSNMWCHDATYIDGETVIDLPLGKVYVEVTKGFEVKPVRKIVDVTARTRRVTIEVSKVLPWREKGWVTADTHVHFLSPQSAMLEGAGEGVNVVNLLASQWGEMMTNVGDFDGKTTFGSAEAGGDGEWLVRVGTENRQQIMGHISLLGYEGRIIAPMTMGGPHESALGDPVGALLTEWARQCRAQDGVVILPHFPNPRLEGAAAIVSGDIDGIEMTSWSKHYDGISPYSLSDWYRYLNCGYFVAAVGGTDKMSASTAVGTVRTYAKTDARRRFTFDAWKDAVRSGRTFVTYGPLIEFAVDGKAPGSRMKMNRTGGTVDVTWSVASCTIPMSRVELIVNGEVRESQKVRNDKDKGHFRLKLDRSSWVALLVRGHYRDKPEVIAAHSSPVMIDVKGTEFFAAADALTILEQIEGSLAYLDTIGTRAETARYKRMRMVLTSAHRQLHNRMHRSGHYHEHTVAADHKEHH